MITFGNWNLYRNIFRWKFNYILKCSIKHLIFSKPLVDLIFLEYLCNTPQNDFEIISFVQNVTDLLLIWSTSLVINSGQKFIYSHKSNSYSPKKLNWVCRPISTRAKATPMSRKVPKDCQEVFHWVPWPGWTSTYIGPQFFQLPFSLVYIGLAHCTLHLPLSLVQIVLAHCMFSFAIE